MRSRLPYAQAQHWGGRVGRNKSVRVKRTEFITRAVDEQRDEIVDRIGDAIEELADRNGFR